MKMDVMDDDLEPNGAPFTFDIIDGNPDNKFRIDRDGVITTTARFDRKIEDSHNITVRVYDNGEPTLHSDVVVHVLIIEESQNPPTAEPLSIIINAYDDSFGGGEIGKIRAKDPDIHDTLHYTITSDGNQFSVHEFDGTISVNKPLDAGKYTIQVSVTDGKFTISTKVKLQIIEISSEMIDNSVVIRMQGVTLEDFIKTKMPEFKKSLSRYLTKADTVHVLSVQDAPLGAVARKKRQATPEIEALVSVEKKDGTFVRGNTLRRRVNSASALLAGDLGLEVSKVILLHLLCLLCLNIH